MRKTSKPRQEGQAAIEFALCAILLFLLIFGIIEGGIIMYDNAIATRMSREAARAAAVFQVDSNFRYSPKNDQDIRTVITNYINNNPNIGLARLITFRAVFDPQSAQDVITRWSSNYTDPNSYTLTSPPMNPDTGYYLHDGNEAVRVTVKCRYHPLVLRVFAGLSDPLTMTSVATIQME
jgi:Flp pilus assembly protein TadG